MHLLQFFHKKSSKHFLKHVFIVKKVSCLNIKKSELMLQPNSGENSEQNNEF